MKTMTTLGLLLGLLFFGGQRSLADGSDETPDVTFRLHKIVFPEGQMPDAAANTGDTSGKHADLLKEYRGLNGVTFDVYDVTERFYQLRKDGQSVTDAQNALSQLTVSELGESKGTQVTAALAGEDGRADFTLPAKDGARRDAVYLFHETAAPVVVKEKSKNLVVVLPIISEEGSAATTIDLYPKNEENTHVTPRLGKTINGIEGSFEYGDIIPFQVTAEIPLDILDYKKFVIKDVSDPALLYQKESLKLTQGGQALPKIYELTTDEHGFTLTFTDLKGLDRFAGQTITLSYEMQLVEQVNDASHFANTATLDTDHETVERKVEVETGGKRFVKVDLEDQKKSLADARFHVLDQDKRLLVKTAAGYAWTDDENNKQLVTLVSKANGVFEVNGLSYGDYYLQEITAPTGYQINQDPIAFTVDANSYGKADDALKVVNLKTPAPPKKPEEPNKPGKPTTPVNKTTNVKRYPKTNDTVNRSLVWLGAILIAVVVVILWQKNKKAGKKEK